MGGLDFSAINWEEMLDATVATMKMLAFSGIFTIILGLPLGIVLYLWGRSKNTIIRAVYSVLSFVVNILRSVPFIILMVALIPFSKSIMGTSIGVLGTIPALVIGAAPFFARLVETALREVDRGSSKRRRVWEHPRNRSLCAYCCRRPVRACWPE